MRFVSSIFLLALLFFPILANAAEPFGLEIGKANLNDVMKSHKGEIVGTNRWTKGAIYQLNPESLEFSGLIAAEAIFDADRTLVGLLLKFPKARFDKLNSTTAKHYPLKSSKTPFVGDKEAIYRDGDVNIELYSAHMSFEMKMYYLHETMLKAFETRSEASANEQETTENKKLFGQ